MRLLSLKVGAAIKLLYLVASRLARKLFHVVEAVATAARAPVGAHLARATVSEEGLLEAPELVQLNTPIVNVIGLKDTAYISVRQTQVDYTEKE